MSFERLILALTAVGLATATPALAAASKPKRTDAGQLKATGDPVTCITRQNVTSIPAGDTYLMFKSGTNTWYRNELRGTCPMQGVERIIVFRNLQGSQFCDLDMFDIVDRSVGANYGMCSLGKFTPVEVPKGTRF